MNQNLFEEIVAPDISHIVIEDDTPVDNFQSAKQQRLLVEPLYASWACPAPFIADSNIGLFYALKESPIVPDAFLSLEVEMPQDWSKKQNRSYFVWEFGKVPEVCIEIVSNKEGNELGSKLSTYARIGVACYAVFDPLEQLQDEMSGALLKVWVLNEKRYVELSQPYWLESVGLGLMVWEGTFEGQNSLWLRWCDRTSQPISTGAERADRLAERLRSMGINPDEI